MHRIVLAILLAAFEGLHAQEVVLGVLEEVSVAGKNSAAARLLFAKEKDRWIALEDSRLCARYELTGKEWVMACNGRNVGAVHLKDIPLAESEFYAWSYKRDKIYSVDTADTVPKIKAESGRFTRKGTVFECRPLLLVSKPFINDPDKWRPFLPGPEYRSRLHQPLKLVIGRFKALRCRENEMVPFRFKSEDIVIGRSYKSSKGPMLISAGLDPKKTNCGGQAQPEWSSNWFLIAGSSVDHMGRGMELVECGDFDNDGRSELLFWQSGYNQGGYVLVYDGFERKAEYIWCLQ